MNIEMLKDNYNRKIGDEEVYTIICELENFYTAYEKEKEKRENQKKELAILNEKQKEFNKLVNTVNSYKGQFKRQQKEIEELKEECKDVDKKWEDKIKAILGIEENLSEERILSLLETIVDENSRLEDIEDRKVQIEYNNVFNKGVKSVEDKIKAEIKELQNMKVDGEVFTTAVNFAIKIMQSLLKEE